MITIQEIYPPRKLSGLSSFLIGFDFNMDIVNTLKTLPTYYYHKKDYKWEIPACYISKVLDLLTPIDSIQLSLLDWPANGPMGFKHLDPEASKPLTEAELDTFKLRPFDHQIEAINYGLANPKFLLLDGMGVGKTAEIILLAETLHKRGVIEHCFIVCGVNAVKQNWKKEIQKFSTESCMILGEKISKRTGKSSYMSIPDRANQLKNPIEEFFIITNVESLRDDRIIEAFNKSANKFGMIALDEAHRCASKSSSQGANLLKLKAPYKIAATGTLLTNSPISCYLPLVWTENDSSTLTMFKSQYCTFCGFHNSQVTGYQNLELLKEELDSCMIRRSLKDVRESMPPKTVTTELLEMSDAHKKFYEAIKDGVKEEVDKIQLNSSNLLALTTRLRQATACPSILTTQDIMSTKIERCVELVEDLVEQGEKVVVLSQFKEPVTQLAKLLAKYNPSVNTGDTDDSLVSKNVDLFQNDPNSNVFLGTFGKCSTGLTLNAASYLIALDESWTAAENNQAWDRIWRISNTKPAFITILMCKDSIDERVHQIAQIKQDLSDYVIDDIQNEMSKSLRGELINLLREL